MNDFDFGWVIGLLEGEGCFNAEKTSARISLEMTDKDVIDRFCNLVNAKNKIYTRTRSTRKTIHRICMYGEEARQLMRLFEPHMSARRMEKIHSILSVQVNARKPKKRRVLMPWSPSTTKGKRKKLQ